MTTATRDQLKRTKTMLILNGNTDPHRLEALESKGERAGSTKAGSKALADPETPRTQHVATLRYPVWVLVP